MPKTTNKVTVLFDLYEEVVPVGSETTFSDDDVMQLYENVAAHEPLQVVHAQELLLQHRPALAAKKFIDYFDAKIDALYNLVCCFEKGVKCELVIQYSMAYLEIEPMKKTTVIELVRYYHGDNVAIELSHVLQQR